MPETREIEVEATPSEAAIDGEAVTTIVPSSISMKKQPATSSARRRSRGTDPITIAQKLGDARRSDPQLEFARPQGRRGEQQALAGAGDEPDLDQPRDRLLDRRHALGRVLDRGQLAPYVVPGQLARMSLEQRGEDHRFDVSLTILGGQGQT